MFDRVIIANALKEREDFEGGNSFIVTGKNSTGKIVYTKSFKRLRDATKRANEIMLEEFI